MQPVPGYPISTPYGRRGPYWGCNEDAQGNGIHTGADYAAPAGTKVVAARPGTATHVNYGSAFGSHQLAIRCSDGTEDFYAHMTSRAAHGTQVEAGEKLGEVGAEGNVTGAHLHFERHKWPGWSCSICVDPAPSINYQPASGSGGSGSGTGEEDMPLNSEDKDWIKGQIQRTIDRMNELMGDVVNHPTAENEDNKVMAKSALGMLLDRTETLLDRSE